MSERTVAIGVSTGGLNALNRILPSLPASFPAPIAIVQHLSPDSSDYLPDSLNRKCAIRVKQAEEKELLRAGTAYIAPPNYHLMIERDRTLSLSVDEPVNFARPSIDTLFETAAEAYGPDLIGVILTGANSDGSRGLKRIKDNGGYALAQDPDTAESPMMPASAIQATAVDSIVNLNEIASMLISLTLDRTHFRGTKAESDMRTVPSEARRDTLRQARIEDL